MLMRRLLEGDLALDDPDVGTHMDRCLGCRACETACPSGVPYGHLLEATRATMATTRRQPLVASLILAVFARHWLLSIALFFARVFRWTRVPALLATVLPRRLAFPMAMLASTSRNRNLETSSRRSEVKPLAIPVAPRPSEAQPLAIPVASIPSEAQPSATPENPGPSEAKPVTAPTSERATAVVLEGCVMRGLFAPINDATKRVLAVNGFQLANAPAQTCCGALHAHAGHLDTARALARKNIAAFEASGADLIAINSAGCGAMIKDYAHLLKDDEVWHSRAVSISAKARDVSELLAAAGPKVGDNTFHARVTYDAPCHLMHAQRITREPITVLSAIPGLDLVPLTDSDQCCGSAGIYNLIEPDTSDAVLAPKLARIAESGASLVATGNPGCLMQIGAGLSLAGSSVRAIHPVELLDASYRTQSR